MRILVYVADKFEDLASAQASTRCVRKVQERKEKTEHNTFTVENSINKGLDRHKTVTRGHGSSAKKPREKGRGAEGQSSPLGLAWQDGKAPADPEQWLQVQTP